MNCVQHQILNSLQCHKKLHPTSPHLGSMSFCTIRSSVERDNCIIQYVTFFFFAFSNNTAQNIFSLERKKKKRIRCYNSWVRLGITCCRDLWWIRVSYLFENFPCENPSFYRSDTKHCLRYGKCLTKQSLKTLFWGMTCWWRFPLLSLMLSQIL